MVSLIRVRPPLVALLLLLLIHGGLPESRAQLTWSDPGSRVRGWRADLDSAVTVFLPKDRSFDPEARERFARDARGLRDSVGTLTDNQLITRLAGCVARAGNAHTRMYLLRNRTVLRRYPVRVWWFGDHLHVVRAHPEHRELLGGEVVAIGGVPVPEVARRVAPLYASNRSWARYLSTYLMTSPEILGGVGVTGDDVETAVTVVARDGRHLETRLRPLPLERSDQPLEAWWDLSPSHPGRQGPWISALKSDSLPLYLRQLTRFYWAHRDDAAGFVYVQYNRSLDQPGMQTVREFGDSLMRELELHPPGKLIIDLRFNTGGNLQLAEAWIRRIASLPLSGEPGRLFVITGRTTFSAGITAVALLRQFSRGVIVGEPVGDGLDFWSEGGNIKLPNTGITLHFADGFHSYSKTEYPGNRPYNYDLSVDDLGPDLPVEPTIEDYLSGRDPALEAVLSYRREPLENRH